MNNGKAEEQKHYFGEIEPIEFMQSCMTPEEFKGFLKGNAIKYIARTRTPRKKNG